jgi:alpha-ketoglutarate-dependent taurine dioxygenase
MSRSEALTEVIAIIERHVDDAHRDALRSTTDPAKGLPRFKTKSQQAQDDRALRVLLRLLGEVHPSGATIDQLQQASYQRIDGATLAVEDMRLRRRLQGIPEVAPQLLDAPRASEHEPPA